MESLNFVSQAIIDKNRKAITNIIGFYSQFNLPAYIRIETGDTGRNFIGITTHIRGWLINPTSDKAGGMSREEYFSYFLNPYTACTQIHGENSKESKLLNSIAAFEGLITIDYAAERFRKFFEPVVISINE